MCEKTGLGGDFMYFTKISTDYVHSTNIAKNLFMDLEFGVIGNLYVKCCTQEPLGPSCSTFTHLFFTYPAFSEP